MSRQYDEKKDDVKINKRIIANHEGICMDALCKILVIFCKPQERLQDLTNEIIALEDYRIIKTGKTKGKDYIEVEYIGNTNLMKKSKEELLKISSFLSGRDIAQAKKVSKSGHTEFQYTNINIVDKPFDNDMYNGLTTTFGSLETLYLNPGIYPLEVSQFDLSPAHNLKKLTIITQLSTFIASLSLPNRIIYLYIESNDITLRNIPSELKVCTLKLSYFDRLHQFVETLPTTLESLDVSFKTINASNDQFIPWLNSQNLLNCSKMKFGDNVNMTGFIVPDSLIDLNCRFYKGSSLLEAFPNEESFHNSNIRKLTISEFSDDVPMPTIQMPKNLKELRHEGEVSTMAEVEFISRIPLETLSIKLLHMNTLLDVFDREPIRTSLQKLDLSIFTPNRNYVFDLGILALQIEHFPNLISLTLELSSREMISSDFPDDFPNKLQELSLDAVYGLYKTKKINLKGFRDLKHLSLKHGYMIPVNFPKLDSFKLFGYEGSVRSYKISGSIMKIEDKW
jgi:hypothetical protein